MTTFKAPSARAAAVKLADQRAALKAQQLRTEMVLGASQPGKGREYPRGAKTHRASAPGDGPAVDRGDLVKSIQARKIGDGHYRVGVREPYAIFLEFGTRKMAARPFVRPAVEKVRNGG